MRPFRWLKVRDQIGVATVLGCPHPGPTTPVGEGTHLCLYLLGLNQVSSKSESITPTGSWRVRVARGFQILPCGEGGDMSGLLVLVS